MLYNLTKILLLLAEVRHVYLFSQKAFHAFLGPCRLVFTLPFYSESVLENVLGEYASYHHSRENFIQQNLAAEHFLPVNTGFSQKPVRRWNRGKIPVVVWFQKITEI